MKYEDFETRSPTPLLPTKNLPAICLVKLETVMYLQPIFIKFIHSQGGREQGGRLFRAFVSEITQKSKF